MLSYWSLDSQTHAAPLHFGVSSIHSVLAGMTDGGENKIAMLRYLTSFLLRSLLHNFYLSRRRAVMAHATLRKKIFRVGFGGTRRKSPSEI